MWCRESLSWPSLKRSSAFARSLAAFLLHQQCPRREGRCNEIYSTSTWPLVEQFLNKVFDHALRQIKGTPHHLPLHPFHRMLCQSRFLLPECHPRHNLYRWARQFFLGPMPASRRYPFVDLEWDWTLFSSLVPEGTTCMFLD